MTVKDYFDNYELNKYSYDKLQDQATHKSTVKDFYNDFIKPHLEKVFIDKRDNLIKWCHVLEEYSDKELPIYWIRKFESGGAKDVNNNRRNGTTILVNDTHDAIATFVYISNYDAQELYNMILHVDDPKDFVNLMMEGDYCFHYDNGDKSCESKIKSFNCLAHARSSGVFSAANLYFAHIIDVNGEYEASQSHIFEKGEVNDWRPISSYSGYSLSKVFRNDTSKNVRIKECDENSAELKKFLKAHFFRFVHPFNYYLVPGSNYEINAKFGKTNKSVGEYKDLTDYVRYKMYTDFIGNDSELKKHFETFESSILINDAKKISNRTMYDINKESEILDETPLHIVYGSTVGKEGQLLEKLRKKHVTNTDKLYGLYLCEYPFGDKFIFKKATGEEEKGYVYNSAESFIDFLEKIAGKLEKGNEDIEISIKQKETTTTHKPPLTNGRTSSKKTSASSPASKSKFPDDVQYELIACYLRNKSGLAAVENKILGHNNSGNTAQDWLNKHGVKTDRTSPHKGLLISNNIDDEIAKASGVFKETLEEIKKRGL